jgi:hypothetical protein
MPDERRAIHELRVQISALLQNSPATPGCKAVASLMAAAYACRASDMPPQVAATMLAEYFKRDPLE